MKKLAVIWGAHACGKTTFVKNFCVKYNFTGYVVDDNTKEFGGKFEEKRNLLERIIADTVNPIYSEIIITGNWVMKNMVKERLFPILSRYDFKLLMVLVVSTLSVMKQELINRKIKLGRPIQKLDTWGKEHAYGRYLNEFMRALDTVSAKELSKVEVLITKHTTVGDFSHWGVVEQKLLEFFGR